ncbi:MAG: hypothetical protein PHO01_08070 [Desulfotomaculaceae bacterium]|nr:hypothetical protein [Desulfotomaculaceae bacterium]
MAIILTGYIGYLITAGPPNRILAISRSLKACQKVIRFMLNNSGIVVFQRYCSKRGIKNSKPIPVNIYPNSYPVKKTAPLLLLSYFFIAD